MIRNISTIVVVVVFLLLAAVGYLVYVSVESSRENGTQNDSLQTYTNATYGISFQYPNTYQLSEREVGNAQRWHDAIILTRTADMPPPQNSEGPPTIQIDVLQNNLDSEALIDWLTGSNNSNFKLSNGTYAPTAVDGAEAVFYHWSGLYEADSIAFLHKGNIVLLSGMYLEFGDPIRQDFQTVVSTFRLD